LNESNSFVVLLPEKGGIFTRPFPRKYDYEVYKKRFEELIGWPHVEIVQTIPELGDLVMVIDDEGKLHNRPINIIASTLYRHNSVDAICGDALIMRQDGEDIKPYTASEALHISQHMMDILEGGRK